jgi:hypothetical protein
MRRCLVWLLLVLAVAACGGPTSPTPSSVLRPSLPPSIVPSSTPVPGTTPTMAPLTLDTPAVVLEPEELAPTPTQAGLSIDMPAERLAVLQPGPNSQVVSPIQIVGRGGPSYSNRVHLRLIGEDGRVIAQQTTHLWSPAGYAGVFSTELPFEISLVAEAARLEVSTDALRGGRREHLATVNLILLSEGMPLIHPMIEGPERLAIFSPLEGARVEGGTVHVRGAGWVESNEPLTIVVLDYQQTVVGSSEVALQAPGVGQLGTFEADVAYQVHTLQYGRIAVFERSADGSQLIHYNSLEVLLRP